MEKVRYQELGSDASIFLPIKSVIQTRDACVTACMKAALSGLGRPYDTELEASLAVYRVSPENNPHRNPEYFSSDGIITALVARGYYVGLHVSQDIPYISKSVTDFPITNIDYTSDEFMYESFRQFIERHIKSGRYILPWLNNQLYDPTLEREYEQHVVVVHGLQGKMVNIMDPDMLLTEEESTYRRLYQYPIERLYNALWRSTEDKNTHERIIIIGDKRS